MWLAFLIPHLIGLVGYNLVLKKSLLAQADRWTLATVMQTGVALPMVVALCLAPPNFSKYSGQSGLLIVLTALLVIGLNVSNVKALQYLEAGVYSVLYNLRVIFTTILGVLFLGEAIVPLQILGGLLIFLAVIIVRQKGSKKVHKRGLEWGITAAIVISVLNLFEKDLIKDVGYLAYSIPVMLLAAVLMWGVLLFRKQKTDFSAFRDPRMIWLMALRALSSYGLTLAFNADGLLSVSTYISSLSVIIIVILGALLLKETDYLKQKLIATGMAVCGLTAILIAHL